MPKHTDALPRLARLFHILHLIQTRRTNQPLGRQELADACQCDVRTIQRDIDLLRRCQIDLRSDAAEKAYVLPEKGLPFFAAPLNLADALALSLARGVLAAPGMPHRDDLRTALDKVTGGLIPPLRRLLDSASQSVAASALPRDYSDAPVARLVRACDSRETLECDYSSYSSGTRKWRRVDPYQVAAREGVFWEMHGWCHENRSIRTFALDRRFHEVRLIGEKFLVRQAEWEAFQKEKSIGGLRGAAGMWPGGGGELHVDVRFTPSAAPYALVHRWPDGLAISDEPDGSARLTGIVTSGGDALLTELLRWRRHANVLGGLELRARVAEEVRAMAEMYTAEPREPTLTEKDSDPSEPSDM